MWKGRGVSQAVILGAICLLAFATRLFSVLRYESMIHEFDPWFNFRSTKYLVANGVFDFHNWFDSLSWYPLGRYIGGTVYPGLMYTAGALHWFLNNVLHFTMDIRNVCVLLSPWMASNTALVTYLLTKEVWDGQGGAAAQKLRVARSKEASAGSPWLTSSSAGLLAAMFVAIAPGYISRSVAGSYDNECIAIFAMVNSFYLWLKAVKSGSMAWAAAAALGYFYMVEAWGGYIFLINIIPCHVFVLMLAGRYSHRLYTSYCTWYLLGTLLSMQVPFVSFQPVRSPEHAAAFGVFALLQLYNGFNWVRSLCTPAQIQVLLRSLLMALLAATGLLVFLAVTGQVPFLTGRLYSLLGATSNIAIVKSVSEHQPSPWTTFFFDLHALVWLAPIGMYYCFMNLSDASAFAILYCLFASYFASIMVRLVLVLTPVICVLAGIGASVTLDAFAGTIMRGLPFPEFLRLPQDSREAGVAADEAEDAAEADDNSQDQLHQQQQQQPSSPGRPRRRAAAAAVSSSVSAAPAAGLPAPALVQQQQAESQSLVSKPLAWLVIIGLFGLFVAFTVHCTWATSTAYSSPSIVLMATNHDGSRTVFDDFREAYMWLAQNTPEDAKIMSWWDYGYQITGMGNRTVIVDNNTRNNTHIATVGLAMASTEERAWPIMRQLDVDYVLVVFGGRIGYSSDDINKFLWMVRISGGVYPEVVETDYFNSQGQYRVDSTASRRMTDSLMYKMCYYRFADMPGYGKGGGFDRVRHAEIGRKDIELTHLEEAFTSEHWMVRIYRVKNERDDPNFLDKLAKAGKPTEVYAPSGHREYWRRDDRYVS